MTRKQPKKKRVWGHSLLAQPHTRIASGDEHHSGSSLPRPSTSGQGAIAPFFLLHARVKGSNHVQFQSGPSRLSSRHPPCAVQEQPTDAVPTDAATRRFSLKWAIAL